MPSGAYIREKIEVVCQYCGQKFLATRSDAKRCKKCNKERIANHGKSEWGKYLRSINHRIMRQRAINGYGGKCACCGEKTYEFLAIDHVEGGGGEDRKTHNTWQIAKRVIELNFPEEYRVLCHNCNLAIGWYGYCPHEKERTA